MENKFEIEKNVPLPVVREKYPFAYMAVGDSFVAPFELRATLNAQASTRKALGKGTFTIRKISDEEVRVWRVA